jgi:tyrosine-protein phosphatase YwqE
MPGVDDGARGAIETIAMARGLHELGVRRLHLTPHQFRLGNDFPLAEVQRRTDEVWRLLARAEIPLEVTRGAEYYFGERFVDAVLAGGELITSDIDGAPHLLVELASDQPPFGVTRVGEALRRRGIVPVLAHPERIRALEGGVDRLLRWREAGWRMQLNLPSLAGRHGAEARDLAFEALDEGIYDFAGSDLHRPADLEPLREARLLLQEQMAPEARP